MFQRLLLVVLSLASCAVSAQRVLTSPDLSTFTTGGIPTISVDPNTGWIYASGFNSRAMGLTRAGLARVTPDGVIDSGWQPSGLFQVFSHVAARNGDLYVHGLETTSGPKVIARYSTADSQQPIKIYRDGAVANNPNTGVGAIYGGRGRYVYFTDNADVGVTLKRIDATTGLVDPAWSYFTSQQLVSVSEGASDNGAIFVLERQYPGIVRDMYVRRIDAGTAATLLWSKTYSVEDASIVASDQFDRVYVVAHATYASSETTVQRLNSSGAVDALWDGRAASQALSQSRLSRKAIVVGDQLLVSAYVDASGTTPGHASLRLFDQSGVQIAAWTPSSHKEIERLVDGRNGRIYASINRTLQVLDAGTLQPARALALTFGSLGAITSVTALPDGGRLFLGIFDVYFGGKRFENVLRTRADGTPDIDWRVVVDGAVRSATITPLGVLLVGNFTQINGVARSNAAVVSLSTGADVQSWTSSLPLQDRVFAFDGLDTLYFTTSGISESGGAVAIRRMSFASQALDTSWIIKIAAIEQGPSALNLDPAGGIWLFRDVQTYFMEPSTQSLAQRFSLIDQTLTTSTTVEVTRVYARSFLATDQHVYIGRKRYVLSNGGQVDPAWLFGPANTTATTVQAIAGAYLYSAAFDYDISGATVHRAALSGNGEVDKNWSVVTTQMTECLSPEIPLFVTPKTNANLDAAEFLIRCRDGVPIVSGGRSDGFMALGTSRNDVQPDKTVVEYFNRDVGRFFITGRTNEQALLDALPASFVRTGMQFQARNSTYRDIPETPVCRLYAAPEIGGSNTHFYGSGDDCPALNTVSYLRLEGVDFAVAKPVNSVCPAGAPNAITRLFNNKVATNEGNHRYVVSAATKSKMIAQGWVDEGAVFCSASVTDAVN